MYCPVHKDKCIESSLTIKNIYSLKEELVPVFFCTLCQRYYFNPNGKRPDKGTLDTGKKVANSKKPIYTTDQPVSNIKISNISLPKKNEKRNIDNIWSKPIQNNKFEKELKKNVEKEERKKTVTNEVRIHRFKKDDMDPRLLSSFAHLQIEYPSLGSLNNINDFISKVFPSGIDQLVVVRNLSFPGNNGGVIRRVELYNKNSNFIKNRLPENTYIAFSGKLSNGELVIEELRVIKNPILKKDDSEKKYIFLYDGPKHVNALWDVTENIAEQPENLKGELAAWSNYLDWKRQLAEMRIQALKYIGIKIDIENRQMSFLAVSEGEDNLRKFRRALRRNEVSAFSNVYSSNGWIFSFNRDDSRYNNEQGIELVFIEEGRHFSRQEIDSSWDYLRDYFKKYSKETDAPDITYLLGGISRNYFEPIYVELKFELSNSAIEIIENNIRRLGRIPEDLIETLAGEFYGDGYLATSQIGDFTLIKRLKTAVFDLSRGKAASSGLDAWLFDISKARLPQSLQVVTRWQNPLMNEKQKRAVEKILSVPDVCLIQGPPGTGKTTVIAEAIYQAVVRNQRVLVASQANLAVDNALERIISNPKVRAIRLGSARKIDSSVNNITEENVLQTFYNSVVQYIDTQFLSKWETADKIALECDTDYKKVKTLELALDDLIEKEKGVSMELEHIDSMSNSEQEYILLNSLKSEKASLSMLKAYINDNVSELELTLDAKTISALWQDIHPILLKMQSSGVWMTRVGIDLQSLDNYAKLNAANDILKHIVGNLKRAKKLRRKLEGEKEFGGSSEELELLKIKEQELKEKVLRDMDPIAMGEWKAINDQIKVLLENGSGMTDPEKILFGYDDCEREQITANRETMREILDKCEGCILQIEEKLIEKSEKFILEINEQQEQFAKKMDLLQLEKNKCLEKKTKINRERQGINESFQHILKKYNANDRNLLESIQTRKKASNVYLGLDRNEWEDLFKRFVNWVDEIPDYAQEKDLFLKTFINGCNVVGVSCTENARTLNEAGFDDFDMVIIDEVSKATPPELLIPMLRGRKIVLVGDHRQLPPLFNEHEKTYQEVVEMQEELLKDSDDDGITELTKEDFEKYKNMVTASLFQRYFENGNDDIKETLTDQYRMHKDIMNIVNLFYDGYLKDGNAENAQGECKNHNLRIYSTSGTSMIIPERHAYWFDSSSLNGVNIYEQRRPGSTSAENIVEAYTIIEMLRKMEIEYANQSNRKKPVLVGVISFYYDQVSLLRTMIGKEKFHEIDVETNTVDRFQGKEKEVIIVSLVRNVKNAKHNTDSHIAAFQRINVAFSRAQNLLIIVGAEDMYAPQPVVLTDMNTGEEKTVDVYKKIIEMMDMKGTLFSCDEVISDSEKEKIFEKLSQKGTI